MRHTRLDGLGVRLADLQGIDRLTSRVHGKADARVELEPLDEAKRLVVELIVGDDVDDLQVLDLLERAPQPDEPRLRVGSPVHAALERDQPGVPGKHARPGPVGKPQNVHDNQDDLAANQSLCAMALSRQC